LPITIFFSKFVIINLGLDPDPDSRLNPYSATDWILNTGPDKQMLNESQENEEHVIVHQSKEKNGVIPALPVLGFYTLLRVLIQKRNTW
jgi:hypothetical protein